MLSMLAIWKMSHKHIDLHEKKGEKKWKTPDTCEYFLPCFSTLILATGPWSGLFHITADYSKAQIRFHRWGAIEGAQKGWERWKEW